MVYERNHITIVAMETWVFIVCWCFLLMTSVAAVGELTVPSVTIGELDESATLRCRLETSDRWYVISWSRLHDNGTETVIVRLPSGQMVPDWNPDVRSVRERFQPLITVQAGLVEFNLVVAPLTCADMGTYRCRGVFGATEDSSEYTDLQLRQPPGTPRVTYDHETPGHRRATWRLSCHADAGLPPQEFQWYVKAPDMRHFQIAEGQAEVEYFTNDGCRVMSRRALLVSLATEDRGTMYRCALPDHVDDDRYYDEVTVEQLPAVSIKEATGDLNCVDDNCLMQAETKSQKNSSQRKCISTSTIGLFAVISYLTGYSLSLVNIKG